MRKPGIDRRALDLVAPADGTRVPDDAWGKRCPHDGERMRRKVGYWNGSTFVGIWVCEHCGRAITLRRKRYKP